MIDLLSVSRDGKEPHPSESDNCVLAGRPGTFVGCIQLQACSGLEGYAFDEDGQLWKFGTGCRPVGWQDADRSLTVESCP